jgi:hypothetical protein
MDRLAIDSASSDQRLALAAELLDTCRGVVVLVGVATLRPGPGHVECVITASSPGAARCEEEYKVLVENAARALRSSKLGERLPDRPLRWVVVDERDSGAVELWRDQEI